MCQRAGDRVDDWTAGVARVVVECCRACGHRWYFSRPCCPGCGAPGPDRKEASGRGRIVAATTVHRGPPGMGRDEAPYGIALVDLDEGVRVMGRCDTRARPGELVWVSVPSELPLPHFVLSDEDTDPTAPAGRSERLP